MSHESFVPELEHRIRELENSENQGSGFTGMDWFLLILTGIVVPVVLLVWGWNG